VADFFRIPIIGLPGDGMGTQASMSQYPLLSRISVTHTVKPLQNIRIDFCNEATDRKTLQNTAYVIVKFLELFNYTNAFFIAESSNEFYNNMYEVVTATLKNTNPIYQYTMKFRTFAVEREATVGGAEKVRQDVSKLLQESQLSTRCESTDFIPVCCGC
jgi:hypothetical protein